LREEKGKGKEPQEEELTEPSPLRYLTSLKWPYIPDEPSYDDPLKRDEPKALKMWDYEAIGNAFFFTHFQVSLTVINFSSNI